MPTSSRKPQDVPAQLRAEFEQIAARAAAAGRPLDPMPALEVAAHKRHGSHASVGRVGVAKHPCVRLGLDLLHTAPADRAWTIAHELSHVLRRQEGTRLEYSRGRLAVAGFSAAVCVAALVTAADAAMSRRPSGLLLTLGALGVLGAIGTWTVLMGLIRREEIATDATAAQLFGEVLTVASVQRIRRSEGALPRYAPAVLRSHPHPAARRRAGLTSRPDLDS